MSPPYLQVSMSILGIHFIEGHLDEEGGLVFCLFFVVELLLLLLFWGPGGVGGGGINKARGD